MTVVKYLLDEHISRDVAVGLRRRGTDCLTVHEAGRRGASDESHLDWALEANRVIVTHDGGFVGLAYRSREHAGLVYCQAEKYSDGQLIRLLHSIAGTESLESLRGTVQYL